jgi:phenylalanyl-tRNA synthetase alpha chain
MTTSIEATALQLVETAGAAAAESTDLASLSEAEALHLGKGSALVALRAELGSLDADQRKVAGAAVNSARAQIQALFAERSAALAEAEQSRRFAAEAMDLSAFADTGADRRGHMHLVTQTRERLEDVFVGMGFRVAEGPEIETDWFNFQALNLPVNHPARSMWDTLYLEAGEPMQIVLRTHTSPVQVRTMMSALRDGSGPPIYVVCPGRTYRKETADATHLPVFHQIEGLVIDKGITMGHLAGTLDAFTKAYFGEELRSRLRPSYFPFTEPSAEFDVSTPDGGWLELGGCGMVHPNVLTACGLDPEEWSGFAFGFGIERLAKIRHGLSDIRDLMVNDVRFLRQF